MLLVSIVVRVSIRTSLVVNFALFRYKRPVIYTLAMNKITNNCIPTLTLLIENSAMRHA